MKDIRYTEKRVDASWKEQAERERDILDASRKQGGPANPTAATPKETSKIFLNFLNSLAVQVLMLLGEIQPPPGMPAEVNADGAKEIIDLLVALKDKTAGNLSEQEKSFFETVLPELQMKYVHRTQ